MGKQLVLCLWWFWCTWCVNRGDFIWPGGNHKCTSPCHTGPCYPCPVTVSKRCACEAAVISVPCIRSKTCQPPRCRLRCQRSPKCDHPSIQSHPCHFGDCPPCSVECGKKLSDCEHKCPVRCHDSVKVKVTPKVSALTFCVIWYFFLGEAAPLLVLSRGLFTWTRQLPRCGALVYF